MKSKKVLYREEDNIAWITMNNLQKLNALDEEVLTGLLEAFTEADSHESVRAASSLAIAIKTIGKPVNAGVQGAAAGAGCNLALCCNFCIAAESASFQRLL